MKGNDTNDEISVPTVQLTIKRSSILVRGLNHSSVPGFAVSGLVASMLVSCAGNVVTASSRSRKSISRADHLIFMCPSPSVESA